MTKKKANGLDYIEIKGDEGAPYIVLLHGFGADYEDLVALSSAFTGTKQPTWIFPNGPDTVQRGFLSLGRSWFKVNIPLLQDAFQRKDYDAVQTAFPEEIKEIRERIEGFLSELGIPPHQMIIGGFSQGAVLATEIALHAFERPLALLVFSGTIVHKASWQRLAMQKGALPFFQSHGLRDPLLPIELAKELETLFLQSGFKGNLHAFDGGHEIPPLVLKEMNLFLQHLLH